MSGVPAAPLARYFEYWLLRLQGVYQPSPALSAEAQAFLAAARASSPFALREMCRSRGGRSTSSRRRIASRSRMHLEKDLKSVRVLREMSR